MTKKMWNRGLVTKISRIKMGGDLRPAASRIADSIQYPILSPVWQACLIRQT